MVNEINEDKCRMLHLGNRNNNFNYSLNGKQLESIKVERDLGILVDDKLKFSEQCNKAANNANAVLGMIKRTITNKRKDIIVKLYKGLVRPKLEYCIQAWRPYLKKDIDKLERVQGRATRLISECRNNNNEDRLKITGLMTLEERRNRGDLIETFKIIKGFSKVDYSKWFTVSQIIELEGIFMS